MDFLYPFHSGQCFALDGQVLAPTEAWPWIYGISAGAIALACFLITAVLVYYLRKQPASSFRGVLWLAIALIVGYGLAQGLELWALLWPESRPAGGILLGTALLILGVAVAVALQILSLPAPDGPDDRAAEHQATATQADSDSKQAELILRESVYRFRAVFEQAAVGMARLSAEGRWLQVNQTFCTLLGYTAAELLQTPFQAVTDPADSAQDEYYYQQLIQRKLDSCRFEKRYLHKDGTPIWTMVTVSTERTADNEVCAFIAVIEDIRTLKTARTALEAQTEELTKVNSLLALTNAVLNKRNEELDQFAYVASHDLKAPLRAIANLSEWIEEDLTGQLPEENKRQLDLLRNRVHRMELLLNGLLEYSRVGRKTPSLETVPLAPLLAEVIDSLAPPATFRVTLPSALPTLYTNRIAIRQVFFNLISNAIKHHDRDDGHVQVAVAEQGNLLEFTVRDDGPGIDARYHQKIFSIFQTLRARDEFESTGIGLAIVKKIIETEGGTIQIESAPGQGSTFRFTWPRSQEAMPKID